MKINIDRDDRKPVYLQISDAIEYMIKENRLVKGYKLPSERKLAAELDVHRNTVVKAYGELVSKGLVLASRQQPRGYFVEAPAESPGFVQRFFPLEKAIQYDFNSAEKKFMDIFWESESRNCISFGGIVMDKKFDPIRGMDDVLQQLFSREEGGETAHLKKNICRILSRRNIYVKPKHIAVVAETNQALSYLMSLYVKAGDCIVAEEPMVPDNAGIFRNKGICVITVPMEADGMDMAALETAVKKHRPKFIYTIPNFHNPTGAVMSLEKRLRLLQIAEENNVPIIEEDYQRELSYSEQEPPSLYVLDRNRSVVYVDSFTLTFPYGVKIGYVVGPTDLIEMLSRVMEMDEAMLGSMGQYLFNAYVDRGFYDAHAEQMVSHYRRKRDLLCGELDKIRDRGITCEKPEGGLLIWCRLEEGIGARDLFEAARERGVLVMPGWVFYRQNGQDEEHIRLCFSNVSDDEICRGVRLLGEALDACRIKNKEKEGTKL